MPKRNSVRLSGYRILTDARSIGRMQAEMGVQCAGAMCEYDLPEGFIPGKEEDERKNYEIGSEIITRDGRYYRCVSAEAGKARWIQMKAEITRGSYKPEKEVTPDPEPEPEPTPEPESETEEVDGVEEQIPSEEEEDASDPAAGDLPEESVETETTAEPEEAPVHEPRAQDEIPHRVLTIEELPFSGWLKKAGIEDVETLVQIEKKDGLESINQISPPRAEEIRMALSVHGYL